MVCSSSQVRYATVSKNCVPIPYRQICNAVKKRICLNVNIRYLLVEQFKYYTNRFSRYSYVCIITDMYQSID